jgi:ParB-like chromosome segregation protein Spo0J
MIEKRPMVCVTDIDGLIYPLGGNMRLKALKELNYKDIPDNWIVMADDWTEEKRKEFVIKDNVGFGEWDWDDLANNWDAEQLTDWGLDIPNFKIEDEKELEDLSDKISSMYRIEVICKDEIEQEQIYNKLIELNYTCKLLTL